jgi:transcriptional/translational regulatory protein YebC/TACO1
VPVDKANEDDLMELVLSAGAEDMLNTGKYYEITCEPAAYEGLKKALEVKAIPIEMAEVSKIPQTTVSIADENTARKIISLMEAFDDHDDVQNAYANFDIPEELIAKVSA